MRSRVGWVSISSFSVEVGGAAHVGVVDDGSGTCGAAAQGGAVGEHRGDGLVGQRPDFKRRADTASASARSRS